MPEHDPLVKSYVHLDRFPRADEAIRILKKVASIVKPIMRARKWKVKELAEFYPDESSLLGVNVDRGKQILLRLRYAGDRTQFIPFDSVLDTMLHELCHMVHRHHHSKFNALWDQLRDEHLGLVMKGYTGEGFLSEGRRLGGTKMPAHEARRLAREAADKRRRSHQVQVGSGQRLGGRTSRPGEDIRKTIADAAESRNKATRGCGADRFSDTQIRNIADTATRNGFRTQAEEDEANEAAISQALWELVQEDEQGKYGGSYIPPSTENPTGNGGGSVMPSDAGPSRPPARVPRVVSETLSGGADQNYGEADGQTWVCEVCTLRNQATHLCCDVCGTERSEKQSWQLAQRNSRPSRSGHGPPVIDLTESPPQRRAQGSTRRPALSASPTWKCSFCRTVMEQQWWTCSTCGRMKETS